MIHHQRKSPAKPNTVEPWVAGDTAETVPSAGARLEAARRHDRRRWEVRASYFQKQFLAYSNERGGSPVRFFGTLLLISGSCLALLSWLLGVVRAWYPGPILIGNLVKYLFLLELGLLALVAAGIVLNLGVMLALMGYHRLRLRLLRRQARLEGIDIPN